MHWELTKIYVYASSRICYASDYTFRPGFSRIILWIDHVPFCRNRLIPKESKNLISVGLGRGSPVSGEFLRAHLVASRGGDGQDLAALVAEHAAALDGAPMVAACSIINFFWPKSFIINSWRS